MKGRSTRISRKLAVSAASLVALVIASAVMANGIPRFSLGISQRVAAQQPTVTPTLAPTPAVTAISGTVADAYGQPLVNCYVYADPWSGGGSYYGYPGADGAYTITGLATGDYRVFAGCQGYVGEYYNDVRNWDDATPVHVVEGEETSGIDFSLDPWGTITGTVTDAGGNPLEDCYLYADPWSGGGSYYGYPGADGVYTITGLATGDYRVFASCEGYVPEYYNGVRDRRQATPVHVVEGEETSGIDFSLGLGGTITGTVTDAGGNPLEDCNVYADSLSGASGYGYGYSGSDGAYTITGLATDDYRVEVDCEGYVREYYNDVRDSDDATPVPVVEGQDTPNIDFSLDIGGTISGVVTNANGDPLEDCDVDADPWSGDGSYGYGYTGSDGTYTITDLATDDYRVEVDCEGYVREYYNNVRNRDHATPVHVVEGQDTPNIDFSLDLGGTISGTVKDTGGQPLDDCWVYADSWSGDGSYGDDYTGPDGAYTITGLATGDYRVRVHCEGYVREYYNNVRNRDHAAPVHVVEGQEHAGIDFSLDLGGTISGTVTNAEGYPLEDCLVSAQPWSGTGTGENGYTDYDGTYAIVGLATNNYLVYVDCDGYVSQYYNGVYDPGDATPVHVIEGQNMPNINFSPPHEGTISGTVQDSQGSPIPNTTVCADSDVLEECGWTDQDGRYTVHGLLGDDYVVNAKAVEYVRQYYLDTRNREAATLVSATEGANTPNIDFSLDLGGTVSALVKDTEGNPIEGAWALASPSLTAFTNAVSPPNIPEDGGICWTVASGECTIRGLATGNYIISASAPNYLTSYFNGATSEVDADPVLVIEGEDTQVDLTLDPVGCGDGNEDRRTSMVDAMLIAQYVVGLIEGGDLNLTMTDVNGNGSVSMVDAMMVAQKVAGLIESLSCNPLPVATPTATATPGP